VDPRRRRGVRCLSQRPPPKLLLSFARLMNVHCLSFSLSAVRVAPPAPPQAHSAVGLLDRHVALRARQLRPFFAAPSPSAGVAAAAGGGADGGRASGDAAAGTAAAAEAEARFAARSQRRFMRQALPASVSREVCRKGFTGGFRSLELF
jgi:hypothetical protein